MVIADSSNNNNNKDEVIGNNALSPTNNIIRKLGFKDIVLRMRDERAGMIQTQEQYTFCYLALVDKLEEILRVLEYKNESWFFKNLDSKECFKLLQSKPHGSFLFRASSVPGCIVLSTVTGKEVINARIGISEQGFNFENKLFPSLAKLVESRHHILVHPILRQAKQQ